MNLRRSPRDHIYGRSPESAPNYWSQEVIINRCNPCINATNSLPSKHLC